MSDTARIHQLQIPDLVARIQQLELEVQHKNEIISDLRDNESFLRRRVEVLTVAIVNAHNVVRGHSTI